MKKIAVLLALILFCSGCFNEPKSTLSQSENTSITNSTPLPTIVAKNMKVFTPGCLVISIKNPDENNPKTQLHYENHILTVEGKNREELILAADTFALYLLNPPLDNIKATKLTGTNQTQYVVFPTITTQNGEKKTVPFSFRTNPEQAIKVPFIEKDAFEKEMKEITHWAFAVGENATGHNIIAGTEISRVVGFLFPIDLTKNLVTVYKQAEAEELCAMKVEVEIV